VGARIPGLALGPRCPDPLRVVAARTRRGPTVARGLAQRASTRFRPGHSRAPHEGEWRASELELIRAKDPERFDAAAARWAGRLALERPGLRLLELGHAVRTLDRLPDPTTQRLLLALADPGRHGPPR
jgi:hypothetical protein